MKPVATTLPRGRALKTAHISMCLSSSYSSMSQARTGSLALKRTGHSSPAWRWVFRCSPASMQGSVSLMSDLLGVDAGVVEQVGAAVVAVDGRGEQTHGGIRGLHLDSSVAQT